MEYLLNTNGVLWAKDTHGLTWSKATAKDTVMFLIEKIRKLEDQMEQVNRVLGLAQ